MEPRFSSGVADEAQLTRELNALLAEKWTLDEERMGVKKMFYFKTYTKCLVKCIILTMVNLRSKLPTRISFR